MAKRVCVTHLPDDSCALAANGSAAKSAMRIFFIMMLKIFPIYIFVNA